MYRSVVMKVLTLDGELLLISSSSCTQYGNNDEHVECSSHNYCCIPYHSYVIVPQLHAHCVL